MTTLKINGKKTRVKTFSEFTVHDYIALRELGDPIDIVKYLTAATGRSYKAVYKSRIRKIGSITKLIGEFQDYTKMKVPAYIFSELGNFEIKKASTDTVGDRFQIMQNSNDMKNEELYCFVLAVAVDKSGDLDKINELKECFMGLPYQDVLPAGFFFTKNLMNGSSRGQSILNWLKKLMRILLPRSKRALAS